LSNAKTPQCPEPTECKKCPKCPEVKTSSDTIAILTAMFWFCLSLFGYYLSFKCNGGFDLLGFLGATFFSPLYVVYKLGTSYNQCFPPSL
jgi:hypothetical protein